MSSRTGQVGFGPVNQSFIYFLVINAVYCQELLYKGIFSVCSAVILKAQIFMVFA